MEVFDFNIHLPSINDKDVNVIIENDLNQQQEGLLKALNLHEQFISKNQGVNYLLFNTSLFENETDTFRNRIKLLTDFSTLTALIDIHRTDYRDYIDILIRSGVKCIMINSYLQRISENDFHKVRDIFKYASEKGLILCVDGSFGTSKMFVYDNLKLLCFLSDEINGKPIVVIHGGGFRIIETMLLALDKRNIYIDTSFSLPFYIGSSIESDFAFALKKLSPDRIVYGSDLPYLNSENALKIHLDFFERNKFKDNQIEDILCHNALNLLGF